MDDKEFQTAEQELKSRFTVFGHLKIDIGSIKACGYSQKRINGLLDDLRMLESELVRKAVKQKEDLRTTLYLSSSRRLHISIRKSKIQAWVTDDSKKAVTQKIDIKEAFHIIEREVRALNTLEPVSKIPEPDREKREYLLGKLIDKQFNDNAPTRGSPSGTCMGYEIDDDFEL